VLLVPAARRAVARRMLQAAGVEARWVPVPRADEVRALDQRRLFESLAPTEEPSDEDVEVATRLLEAHDPLALVTELVRASRSRAPEPEDLPHTAAIEDALSAERSRHERPREQPARVVDGVWFRIDLGRRDNAFPKLLLPLLCRRGSVDRRFIGRIRVLEGESHFEVHPEAAQHFEHNARRPDRRDPTVRIRRMRATDAP